MWILHIVFLYHDCCRKTELLMRKKAPFPTFLSLLIKDQFPHMLRISACSTEKCLKCNYFKMSPSLSPTAAPFFPPVFLWAIACDLKSKQLGTSENVILWHCEIQDMCCGAQPRQVAATSKKCKGSPGIPGWASLQGQAASLLELAWPACGIMMSRSLIWPSP